MFDSKPTLIYADTSDRLISFSYNTELAYIRSALLENGVSTTQFIEEQPSDLLTVVDDITFFSSDCIIFYIDTYLNLQLSHLLQKEIQTQDFLEQEIIFLYKNTTLMETISSENIKHFTINQFSLLSSYLGGTDDYMEDDVSVYLNNIVPLTYLTKVGLHPSSTNSIDGFKNDIEHIRSQNVSDGVIPIILSDEEINIHEILRQIKSLDTTYHFALPINLLSPHLLEENSIQEYTVILDNGDTHAANLSLLYQQSKRVNFVIPCDNEENLIYNLRNVKMATENGLILGKIHFNVSKKIHISNEFIDIINNIKIRESQQSPFDALYNGILMFYTGIYRESIMDGSVKHVLIEGDVNQAKLNKLSKLISINSAILYPQSAGLSKQRELNMFDGEIIFENGNYTDYQRKALESSLFTHHHQWDGKVVQLDNNEIKELSIEPYGTNNHSSLADLETPDDFQLLLNDVKHFEETGSFRSDYQIKSKLINSCRWLGPSNCQVTKLPRFTIREDESLSPCMSCHKGIGTLDNELFELKENIQMIVENEKINRGCASCEVKNYCSKCVFLPEYMNAEQYCYTRKNHLALNDYVISSQILNFILNHSNYLKSNNIKLKEIKFSNSITTHLFNRKRKENSKSLVNSNIYLVNINGEFIIFNLEKYNIIKVGTFISYILEAFYKGYIESEVLHFITEDFNIDLEKATDYYYKSIKILLNAEVIKEMQGVTL